jgi:poly(A) polymerase
MSLRKVLEAIYKVSKNENIDVYAVGGYVRDRLLGKSVREMKDVDFVVLGSGLEFAKKIDEMLDQAGTLIEFPDFDTARYVFTRELKDGKKKLLLEIEFAGARSEKYDKKSRKPKVESASLEKDLSRRDFTVNAMAAKVMAGGISKKIEDYFGGQDDLKNKILKTPLESNETFSDDPLRMLRAARFAAQLDFEIEENIYNAIIKNKNRLKIISAERIQEELFKLLASPKPSIGFWILFKTKLLDEFLPEVTNLYGVEEVYGQGHKNNFDHTLKVVDGVANSSNKTLLRYAALMHDIGKPGTKEFQKGRGWTFDMHEHLGRKIVRQIGKRLRISKDDTEYVAKLVRWHQQPIQLMDEGITDSPVRRLIVNLEDDLDDLLVLCRNDITTGNPKKKAKRLKNYDRLEKRIAEVMEKDKLREFQSPVRGEEIMKDCGLKPGPTVGKIKKNIEDAILDGVIPNEYEDAKKYFLSIKDDYLKNVKDWELE